MISSASSANHSRIGGHKADNPSDELWQVKHQALHEELDLTKQALAQSYEQLQSIYYWAETTDGINQASSVRAIYEAACQGFQHVFSADLVNFVCWEDNTVHWDEQAPVELRSALEDYNPWANSIVPYSPVVITSVKQLAHDSKTPHDLFLKQPEIGVAGIQSLLWLPIASSHSQSVLGYLGVYFYHETQFDDALLTLGQTMIRSIVLAVDRKQSEVRLQKTLEELHRAQLQLVQNEKMSSLGQLVAGIAHEINNPVNFITGNLSYLSDCISEILEWVDCCIQRSSELSPDIRALIADLDLDFLSEDLPKTLSSMEMGADRIRDIVASLRTFSRLDEDNFKSVDLHEGIDSTLMILQHRLKTTAQRSGIEVVKDYGNLPKVSCYSGPLNQVFMNLLSNAVDAIEEQPAERLRQITIRTALVEHDWVEIAIADSGNGIPDSVKAKVFDPFFTTKPIGQGTGMGLSISYTIVTETHQGELLCHSEPGSGTTFTIRLPLLHVSDEPRAPDELRASDELRALSQAETTTGQQLPDSTG